MIIDFVGGRREFPTLLERTYFASQCLGAFPRAMLEDVRAYERSLALRARVLSEWVARFEEMHTLGERLVEAPAGSIFLRDSATAAQASIAAAIEPEPGRKRVLVASGDFHSSRYLWHAQAKRGFEVVEVASNDEAHGESQPFLDAIDERVRVVALSLVSPRTGALLDARPIVDAAHRAGALVVLDVFQAVGIVPVRVEELGADVLVGGYYKWVGGGGTGLAFGYVAPALSAKLEPIYPGWLAHRDLLGFSERFEAAKAATKFQQGMPAMEPIYTSRAGIRWVLEAGIDRIRARSLALTERMIHRAVARGLSLRTPREPEKRGGMVCFRVPDADAERIMGALEQQGIDIDHRPGAGLRVGPHVCATEEECDRVVDALAEHRS
ncbi:aminotransferase class V-fold PLP-dependent enzyme [Pendulispora albinea]|uniref:Aminotransferase class V-fold PLP-dependent enzyme n=1 Tax=Pendulispora albinea TaxID=2741071 RepID=A0ABZ2LWJ0_9BACT